jgi:hypothetical protein
VKQGIGERVEMLDVSEAITTGVGNEDPIAQVAGESGDSVDQELRPGPLGHRS